MQEAEYSAAVGSVPNPRQAVHQQDPQQAAQLQNQQQVQQQQVQQQQKQQQAKQMQQANVMQGGMQAGNPNNNMAFQAMMAQHQVLINISCYT